MAGQAQITDQRHVTLSYDFYLIEHPCVIIFCTFINHFIDNAGTHVTSKN